MWKKSLSSTFSFYLLHFQFFAHHSLTSRNSSIIRITKAKAFIAHIYLQLAEELTQEYGIPEDVSAKVTAVFLKQFRKCPDNATCTLDAWRTILWSKALGDKYSRFARKVYERWLYLRYHYMVLTPATVSMLRQLRKKYLLGLITNGPSNAQWEKVRKLSLEQYFDIILVSGDLPWEKPDVEIFQKACDLLNVRPKECIMVGDKLETDILAQDVLRSSWIGSRQP
ncbi:N-acylneuraminate-9-phosphatase isoform X4 [Harpegnathos saltator]|uniref:N-acylneuraminate-9-phosphatase isoform X4 n=1 Tax=Harpegnathos saltator TaxID=610380 RepID=UPI00058D3BF3|nr:N-acylneuraminate-9-phosphatase isoform X4 [Harpegnathos saltator]